LERNGFSALRSDVRDHLIGVGRSAGVVDNHGDAIRRKALRD
jgi:hypothetical protein